MAENPPIEGPLRLIGLRIQDFHNVELIDLSPSATVTEITGANGAGKSTVFNAVAALLNLFKSSKAVRDGATESRLLANLGPIQLERVTTGGTDRIAVRPVRGNVVGAAFKRPAEVLESLYETTTEDPMRLFQLTREKFLKSLADSCGLTGKLDEMEARRVLAYDNRTGVNREVKQAESQLAGMAVPPDDTPDELVVVADLMGELEAAETHIRANGNARNRLEQLVVEAVRATEQLEGATAILGAAKLGVDAALAAQAAARQEVANLQASVDQLADPPTGEIKARIGDAENANRNVEARQRREELVHTLSNLQQKAQAYTTKITSIEAEKTAALIAAELPVEGLKFSPGGMVFHGQPFELASKGERLRVVTELAMDKAVKSGKPFKLLLLRDASTLDATNRAVITDAATAKGFQTLVELVNTTGDFGVYLVNGAVKAIDGKPVADVAIAEAEGTK